MEQDKKNILIVDDDKFLLDMYTIKFNQSGFNVTSCLGSVEALKKIEEGLQPDVMLCDIIMPTMDGFEFLEKVKNENLLPNTLTIMLTNLGQDEDIKRAETLGAKGHIVKASVTPTEVVKKVDELMASETVAPEQKPVEKEKGESPQ